MELYQEISRQIRDIFARYTPEIEPLSLDEAFLDVTASEKLFGSPLEIAQQIKQVIQDELGLIASVGVAPNKFLAKIASDLEKPDGLVTVEPDAVQEFLDPLPISRLWGVGKVTAGQFERLGIQTIGQLRRRTPEFLEFEFGKFGKQIWELAHGRDSRPVVSDHRAKSLSTEHTFAEDIRDSAILRAWLIDLCEQVGFRIRQHGFYGRTVQIKLRFADFRTITRAQTLDKPSQSTADISHTALELLARARPDQSAVRLLGVGISGLDQSMTMNDQQGDLFTEGNNSSQRQQELDELADAINTRFGKQQLRRGGGFHRR
jgi:DNA polymerase-4